MPLEFEPKMDSVSLTALPLEILERIFLLLPPAFILRMKEVNAIRGTNRVPIHRLTFPNPQ